MKSLRERDITVKPVWIYLALAVVSRLSGAHGQILAVRSGQAGITSFWGSA